ncbi:MAG: cardiolipin synthase ClsB [Proteobacteria bacterium]|nr:cardiolipin synthase ClsB [Pseudomonadota bacterium]
MSRGAPGIRGDGDDDANWRSGNRVRLLENGEAFFAAVFEAIAQASEEVLLETFILFEDKVGCTLQQHLIAAAMRGVRVEVLVDSWGSPDLSAAYLSALTRAGVRFRVFDPHRRFLGKRLHMFRRMHRKIVVVDATRAFVGGINYSVDHLEELGVNSKQDYSVELQGPVVSDIRDLVQSAIDSRGTGESWRPRAQADDAQPRAGEAEVLFAVRDNGPHSTSIEDQYRHSIRQAREQIVIANAYFCPGYGLLRELRDAAQRGVRVTLVLQGQADMAIAQFAARSLYRMLMASGIEICEYHERQFHGKVALIDGEWATVGSSNLDPLSLSLNLEANVFIRDASFNRQLRDHLSRLMHAHCHKIDTGPVPPHRRWHALVAPVVYHFLRRFPAWAGLLPAHTPRKLASPAPAAGTDASG